MVTLHKGDNDDNNNLCICLLVQQPNGKIRRPYEYKDTAVIDQRQRNARKNEVMQ